ncbi:MULTISPECIES: acyl-CoA dehydrogenase family protein [Nocardia]|uniref:Acyl-CoA dehydrogenase n=1 Tax=Nocardia nova TaxID=37330 RepID=A0A2T2ZCN5_9NOCA|nr:MULTISPECIES: acyl-CoA dehydrogenase family protein [Nocardia]PSR65486.1 acyl-CoA dehydrogenase [Nocardia nova]
MNVTMDESQDAVAEIVVSLLERVSARNIDLWPALLGSGLLSAPLPQRYGGEGLGLLEVSAILKELATDAVEVPVLSTLGFGVLPLLRAATDDVMERVFPAVAEGAIVTAALNEPGAPFSSKPSTTAITDGTTVRISGHKVVVQYASRASWILVPTDSGLAVVDAKAPGISRVPNASPTGVPEFTLRLDNVSIPAEQLLPDGVPPLKRLALATIGSVADGLLHGVLRRTVEQVQAQARLGLSPIQFRAASRNIHDIYVASRAVHSITLSANRALAQEDDSAEHRKRIDTALETLAYRVATALPEAVRKCYQLNGIGSEHTAPLYRYYSQAKAIARIIGGSPFRPECPRAECALPRPHDDGAAPNTADFVSAATSVATI